MSLSSCSHEEMASRPPSLSPALPCDLLLPIERARSGAVTCPRQGFQEFCKSSLPLLGSFPGPAGTKEARAGLVDEERPGAGEPRLPANSQHHRQAGHRPGRLSDDVVPEEQQKNCPPSPAQAAESPANP